jgi:hypothetical protein
MDLLGLVPGLSNELEPARLTPILLAALNDPSLGV